MNKHESLVREIAEEMAKEDLMSHGLLEKNIFNRPMSEEDQSNSISRGAKRYLPAARITVKRMAQSARQAYKDGIEDGTNHTYDSLQQVDLLGWEECMLKKFGLIPEQEGGQDER